MPRVPLKNKNIIQSAYHISLCAQFACHTMYHVSKYAQSYGGGGFPDFFFYKGANQTENFTRVITGNDIYYRVKNTINP